jgi:disulfide bond formation protein DsbB
LGAAPLLLSLGNVPLCAFRQLTGKPCPLCGGTRACAALVEGNLMAAWQANPGLMPLLTIAAVHASQLAYEAWSGRKLTRWQIGPGTWSAGAAFLLCDWVLRLAQ